MVKRISNRECWQVRKGNFFLCKIQWHIMVYIWIKSDDRSKLVKADRNLNSKNYEFISVQSSASLWRRKIFFFSMTVLLATHHVQQKRFLLNEDVKLLKHWPAQSKSQYNWTYLILGNKYLPSYHVLDVSLLMWLKR